MKLTRWCAWAVSLTLLCGLVSPLPARAADADKEQDTGNLARTAKVSGSNGRREQNGPDKAVDGKQNTYFFANSEDAERYLLLDLGKAQPIERFALFFYRESPEYSIQLSADGISFDEVVLVTDGKAGKAAERTFSLPSLPSARYVKLLERQPYQMNSETYSFAIREFEVYGVAPSTTTAAEILQQLDAPALSDDGKTLLLPDPPDPHYQVTLYGCEPQQVIALDGTVSQPLCDTEVSILYQVQHRADPGDCAKAAVAQCVMVPGLAAASGNEKPNVVPGLREWQGGEGDFCLTGGSALVLNPEDADMLGGTAEQIAAFFADMLEHPVSIRTGKPGKGDVLLCLDPTLAPLGEEGYTLDCRDVFTIAAATPQGVLYGGVSLTQVLWQDPLHSRFPKGQARDYPRYPVRGGMLDLASAYLAPDELSEIACYMAWFKLNELHLHWNDSSADSGKSAFRLACEGFPSLTAADGFYTKEEYRALQTRAKSFGVELVSEIVGPGRGACFQNVSALPLDQTGTLDFEKPEAEERTVSFLQQLMQEYLAGDEPFLQGAYYDVGIGIYGEPQGSRLVGLADTLAQSAEKNGKHARVWYMEGIGAMGTSADILLWTDDPAAAKAAYGTGRGVIDTRRSVLQLSTAGRDGLPDRFALAPLFDRYSVEGLAGAAGISPADPQTRGAVFCFWNGQACPGGGYSSCDLFDRIKNAVALVAEKTWCGANSKQTGAQFTERFAKVGMRAGSANPGRFVDSQTDVLADLDFYANAKDKTANGRDGAAQGSASFGVLEDKAALCLDGNGVLAFPIDAVGYPYTIHMDLFCNAKTPPDALLLKGADGSFYLDLDGTGYPGYRRGGYTFRFDGTALPEKQWFTLVLTCGPDGTALYIDGQKQHAPMLCDPSKPDGVRVPDSTAFYLPTARIGEGLSGGISALTLYNRVLTDGEIAALTVPHRDEPSVPDPPPAPDDTEDPKPSPEPDKPDDPSGGGTAGGGASAPNEIKQDPPAVLLPNGTQRTESTQPDGTRQITDLTPAGVRIITLVSPEGLVNATVSMPEDAPPLAVTIPVGAPHSGLVPFALLPDGSESVIPKSAVTNDGVIFICSTAGTFRIADRSRQFNDLTRRSWAKDAVDYVTSHGLFGGMNESDFVPDGRMSRGMLATVLHRLESCPAPAGHGGFSDLLPGRYYSEAAVWAAETGLIRGIGADFAADQPISREQLITILHRYAGSPAPQGTHPAAAAGTAVWAQPAMQWAQTEGLLTGRPGGRIDPKAAVTRAETAVVMERLVNRLLSAQIP